MQYLNYQQAILASKQFQPENPTPLDEFVGCLALISPFNGDALLDLEWGKAYIGDCACVFAIGSPEENDPYISYEVAFCRSVLSGYGTIHYLQVGDRQFTISQEYIGDELPEEIAKLLACSLWPVA